MAKKKIYFASPLFSSMELRYNASLVKQIRDEYPDLEVYLPQEQADINDKSSYASSVMIAQVDTQELLSSDLLIAVLDGISIDAGVASEIGVAYQAGIPIIALYTDSRQSGYDNKEKLAALEELGESQFSYVNLYTVGLCKMAGELVGHEEELLKAIPKYI